MTWMSTPYMRSGVELDRLTVEGIRVTGHHGVLASERETGQLFKADVVAEVASELAARVAALVAAGVDPDRIVLDLSLIHI